MRRLWLAFAFLAAAIAPAFADSLVVQNCRNTGLTPLPPGSTRLDTIDIYGTKCTSSNLPITGGARVELVPSRRFVDTFNSLSTLDVVNWAAPTTSGTGATATYTQGQEILFSGTANGAYSYLVSNPTFQISSPGFLLWRGAINSQVEVTGTCKEMGLFLKAATPTCAAPVTDGALFEITTTGKLQAVTYAGGVRQQIADLSINNNPYTAIWPAILDPTPGATAPLCPQRSTPQAGQGTTISPADTCPHILDIYFNGNSAEFDVDFQPVAFMKVGNLGPNNNLLSWAALAINAGNATGATLKINQAVVADEGNNGVQVCDPTYSFQCAAVSASGGLGTTSIPSSSSSIGITPVVSSAAEASHVLKASAGNLYGVYISNPSASGFLMVFNSATVPGDGAVTPLECVPVSASNVAFVNFIPGPPEVYSTGISAALSSTGCFTKTTSPTGYFHGSVQ